jgi:hypothetical protein
MRLIFDEDLLRALPAYFERAGHEVAHVNDLGWKGVRNSELLHRVSGQYDALITGDMNMRFQQNLKRYDIAVVVLQPRIKLLDELVDLVPATLGLLPTAAKGTATVIRPEETQVG